MYLAMDKNGRLGRKMGQAAAPVSASPTAVPQATIQAPPCAEYTSNVQASPAQIQSDNQYWNSVDAYANQCQAQKQAQAQSAQALADSLWYKQAAELNSFQNKVPANADDQTVINYLIKCVNTPESERMARSISPNFNINRLAPGSVFQTPTQNPDSDFNQFQLMGNPLTRNGQYGVVTDWDRFVRGVEMENAEITGSSAIQNTILRKHPSFGRMGSYKNEFATMGDDGDDGDDSEDADMAASAAAAASAPPVSVAAAAPAGSSASDYTSLPDVPAGATTTTSSSSSGINWTSVLGTGLTSAGGIISKELGIKPTTTTGATGVAAASAPGATILGMPAVLVYMLFGVTAIGAGIFIYKKMKS